MAISGTSAGEFKDVNEKKSKAVIPCGKIVPENFQAIQNPIAYNIISWIPFLSMFIMVLLLVLKRLYFFNNAVIIAWLPVIISAYYIGSMLIFAQRLFMKKIPETFSILWCRKIIVGAYQSRTFSSNTDSKDPKVIVLTNFHLEEKYIQFINEIQERLNNSRQWLFGLFLLLLTLLWNPLGTLNNFDLLWLDSLAVLNHWDQMVVWQSLIQDNWHILNEFPVSLIAFISGLMVWRMYVISGSINKLVDTFQIEPKHGHPDMAGGLSPIGNLCMWNCIIASIPSVYISGWLLIRNFNEFPSPYTEMPNYYTYEFLVLLLTLSTLPIVFLFIKPLWKVHQEMDDWRNSKKERLHEVGDLIHQRESRLLHETEKLNRIEYKSILTELEELKQLYTRNEKLPRWPFNMEILWNLLITYTLVIIAVLSQLYISFLINSGLSDKMSYVITFIIPFLALILQYISLSGSKNKI
ncbi:hypothetical protein [Methanosarcina sp.]|uniref:hypothetical protein n=1 Tax=Methanosarcina sp. TaxID=2213 RepID=UPI003BB6FA8F